MNYLTKEQRESLEKRLKALKDSQKSLSESLAEEIKSFKVASGDSMSSSVLHTRESLFLIEEAIKETESLLSCAVEPTYDSEKIAIGTKFTAVVDLNGKLDEDKYMLVQANPNYEEGEYRQISLTSPIGSAVFGKKENETFEYTAPAGVFKGVITSIVKENVKEENEKGKQKTIGTHPQSK